LRDCNQKNNQKNGQNPAPLPIIISGQVLRRPEDREEWANLTNVSVALKAGAGDDMVIECLYCLGL
jgi:hypothetical protein